MTSRLELSEYPYVQGERGIPFENLIHRAVNGEIKNSFTSGSQNQLEYEILPDSILISTSKKPVLYLYAGTIDGVAFFNLRTLSIKRVHHPDMFARRFVDFALNYFEKNDLEVNACKGFWNPKSDNNKAFFKEAMRTGDIVAAAKSTWSGRVFCSKGFTQITKEDVFVDEPLWGQGKIVVATFHKPKQ